MVTIDGTVVARSVEDPDDPRSFVREYPEGEVFAHVVGYNSFLVGSTGGVHVWMRLEIAERPVPPNWDGSDVFEDGESEDYLVEVTAPVPVEQGSWGQIKSVYR